MEDGFHTKRLAQLWLGVELQLQQSASLLLSRLCSFGPQDGLPGERSFQSWTVPSWRVEETYGPAWD